MTNTTVHAIAPRRPNALDRVIGAQLEARRTEVGMSADTLAEQLGISVEQLRKFERGTARIAACQLLSAADILNVPRTALLPLSNDTPARGAHAPPLDPVTAEIVERARALSSADRKRLLKFAGELGAQARRNG